MGKDYYEILEIKRDSQQDEIAKAYRKLGLKYHPQLSKLDPTTSLQYFCLVSEAYEVLSDPVKRAFFDKYGEEMLKEGFFSDGELKGGYRFNGNPEQIFEEFFGSNNAFGQIYDSQGKDDYGSLFGYAFGNINYSKKDEVQKKVVKVKCSLNELYNGCSKQVEYQRQILNQDGRTTSLVDEKRMIEIKKGFSSKNIVSFKQLGNEAAGQQSSDLVFEIVECSHSDYKREGDNLVYTKDITLMQALTAESVNVITLDGRQLLITMDEVINPKTVRKVVGEGMPILGSGGKGDLFVKFNIQFPEKIPQKAKELLQDLLKE